MARFLDGYQVAIDVAVGLDAFRAEVLSDNEEYTRGIVELIAHAFVDTEGDFEPGGGFLYDKIIEHGVALTEAYDVENAITQPT